MPTPIPRPCPGSRCVFPLLALGVLSTLFFVSHRVNPDEAVALSGAGIEDRIRQPRVTAPVWAGVTGDGASLTVTATVARPASVGDAETGAAPAGPDADAVTARLVGRDGSQTEMTGDHGRLDEAGGVLAMTGHVVITTASGLRITSDALTSALDATLVVSEGPVTGTGPFGRIDAGSMRLTLAPGQGGDAGGGGGGGGGEGAGGDAGGRDAGMSVSSVGSGEGSGRDTAGQGGGGIEGMESEGAGRDAGAGTGAGGERGHRRPSSRFQARREAAIRSRDAASRGPAPPVTPRP